MEDKDNASQQGSSANAAIFLSIGLAVLLLAFMLIFVERSAEPSYKSIKLATGEWAPYTSADLPEYGLATAVVSKVMKDIGYKPDYTFMPWASAEQLSAKAERDNDVRGVFPYSDPRDNPNQKSDRNAQFYFSESLIDIEIGVFYDKRYNPLGSTIVTPADLQKHNVVKLEGYEYPPQWSAYLNGVSSSLVKDNRQAFELFQNQTHPFVVIESIDVGRRLVEQYYPSLLPFVEVAPLKVSRDVRLMLAKRNPNNLSLIRQFNKKLLELKANQSAFENFMLNIENKLELSRAVELIPLSGEAFIYAYATPEMEQAVLLPSGSQGIIRQWHAQFLTFQPMPIDSSNSLVKIKLLNGPFASQKVDLYVQAASIQIPTVQNTSPK